MTPADQRLEFLGALGKGGFGSIYLANLRGTDGFVRRVAVKVLRYAGTEDAALVARQRDEARLLGLLSHESIVQVIDQATVLGRPAVIMEYVEGVDMHELSRLLRSQQVAFSPRAAFEVIAAVAGALDVAWSSVSPLTSHPLHVVHRDIKPGNILLTVRGGVKVLDFGIARAEFDRDGVSRSIAFGTPSYMAPEFWQQEPIGHAYDIYALGVTLIELLSGQPADRAPMEAGRAERFFEEQLSRLDLPDSAAGLIRDMVAFDVAQRCSAAAVQERALELVPVLPGAPLAREARAWVPELLSARARAIAAGEKPTPEALGLVGVVAASAMVAASSDEASVAVAALVPETLALRSHWYWAAGAGVIGALGVAGFATVALIAAAGLTLSNVATEQAAETPSSTPAAAPAAGAVPAEAAAAEAPIPVPPSVVAPVPAAIEPEVPDKPRSAAAVPTPASVPAASLPVASAPAASVAVAPAAPVRGEPAPVRLLSFGANVVGAALVIDGASQGKTPTRGVSLGDGGHWIVAKLGDRSCSQHIVVGPDQPSGYVCDLDAEKWTSKI